jgi:hypothetical protein
MAKAFAYLSKAPSGACGSIDLSLPEVMVPVWSAGVGEDEY